MKKITTKSGSVYNVREEGNKFFLTADNKPNPYMPKVKGEIEVMIVREPRVGEAFIFYGQVGTPFQSGVRTSPVESIEEV